MDDNIIEGKNWEPIVSRETFLKANEVLTDNRQKFQNHKEDDAIPLRHMIYCHKCKRAMTGYLVKLKNIYYYKCNTIGCRSNKSAKEVHKGFIDLLERYQLNPKFEGLVRKQLKLSFEKLGHTLKEKSNDSEKRKVQLLQKIENIEEKYINEGISKEMYEKFRKKYETDLSEIIKEIPTSEKDLSNLEKMIDSVIEKCQNLSQYWISAPFYKKQTFQKAVFPDKIYYHVQKGTYRTTKVNEILSAMSRLARVSGDSTFDFKFPMFALAKFPNQNVPI